jgi:hypothetical protein
MTVNERLFNAGTIEQIDLAVRRGDRETMIALLVAVEIEPTQAEKITDTTLAHPTRYGRI